MTHIVTLEQETRLVRYGSVDGKYAADFGAGTSELSLNPKIDFSACLEIVIKSDIEVMSGKVAPWFEQKGDAIQYRFEKSVKYLLGKGIITVQ